MNLEPGPNATTIGGGLGANHGALIIRIAQRRDRTAFIVLFQPYGSRVKSYLRRWGAADAMSEDLAREALLPIWRKANRFDPAKAGASSWIFTIARNLWIDPLRKERRPELDPTDPLLVPDDPEDAEDADNAQEIEQRDGLLRTALGTLPAKQAEVVRLACDRLRGIIGDHPS
ncbi:MAG: sigma-70 family RNA polymerase sigma factor [Rhodospirillum sp.]|nr:sigma-70 family RNA polymerase sigma factor [Rhodospirillum sp.]MCF8492146.1 sigma-70 family RNA polymerase sigma factor [Rhodospirillum sp.]MCF8502597.1 sigma-70 family RNA polymerase sigma factor [Rhodospirillum sp.]